MNNELTAYLCLALLVSCVASVGLAAAILADGALSYPVGAAAAAVVFQVLRHTAGRVVGAAIDH